MAKVVDERVVEMKFENGEFEKNVKQSLSTIEKLDKSLDFKNEHKGLENLIRAARTTSSTLGSIGTAADTVRARFSAMQIIGVTALANITNSAVNAGKRISSALTIKPIYTGFQEYETKMKSIQTIMANTASKGTTMTDVTKALDELNRYADLTIYNFTEMTRNVGTFTAAGVELDTAVSAIQGIANLAATSGSTSQQASTAMYQLSQAIAAGTIRLMDWNSVVNAGMGGDKFQTALKATAREMGIAVDDIIKKQGSFRESLSEGWLSAEVLNTTLKKFTVEGATDYARSMVAAGKYTKEMANALIAEAQSMENAATKVKTFTQLWDILQESAQSGWAETWELLIGNFEEASESLTGISDLLTGVISQSSEARNTFLRGFLSSNWKKLQDEIYKTGLDMNEFQDKLVAVGKEHGVVTDKMITDAGSFYNSLKSGWMSSDIVSEALASYTKNIKDVTKVTSSATKKFEDFKKVVDEVWGGATQTNENHIRALATAGYQYSDVQEVVNELLKDQSLAFEDLSIAQMKSLGLTAEEILVVSNLSEKVKESGNSINILSNSLDQMSGREYVLDTLLNGLKGIIEIASLFKTAWVEVFPAPSSDVILGALKSVDEFSKSLIISGKNAENLKTTLKGIFSVLHIVATAVKSLLEALEPGLHIIGILGSGLLSLTASIGSFLIAVDKGISAGQGFSSVTNAIHDALYNTSESLASFVDSIRTVDGVASNAGKAIASIFNGLFSLIGKFFSWLGNNISLGDVFAALIGTETIFLIDKISKGVTSITKAISDFGKNLRKTFDDSSVLNSIKETLSSLAGTLDAFAASINIGQLAVIATSLLILTIAISNLSKIDAKGLTKASFAMGVLFTEMSLAFSSITRILTKNDPTKVLSSSVMLIAMATAMNILANATAKFGSLSWGSLAKGIAGFATGMFMLVAAMRAMENMTSSVKNVVVMLMLAGVANAMASALSKFASLSWADIIKGLIGMGAALGELTAVTTILGNFSKGWSFVGSVSIALLSTTLKTIAKALKEFASLDWDEIKRGLVAMGGALTELSVASGALGKLAGFSAIIGSVSIGLLSDDLMDIALALEKFGSLHWSEIGRGLIGMGGALTELAVVAGLLGNLGGIASLLGGVSINIIVDPLNELADAFTKFSWISWDGIAQGLLSMGGALTELSAIAAGLGYFGGLGSIIGGAAINVIVAPLSELATALQMFGAMDWDAIARGLVGMGGALAELATVSGLYGYLANVFGLLGSASLAVGIYALDDLANALMKFASMSWDEVKAGLTAMGAALGETAIGGILNTLSILGSLSISIVAEPLGDLADSMAKWKNVSVPEKLGDQIGSLAGGIMKFTLSGFGASAIATVAKPLGDMADSIDRWSTVTIPEGLSEKISSFAGSIRSFTFSGIGAMTVKTVAEPLGILAESVMKWADVKVPETIESDLTSISTGVKSFTTGFVGGWTLADVVGPIGQLADAMTKWKDVTVPATIGDDFETLATGIKSFGQDFFTAGTFASVTSSIDSLANGMQRLAEIDIATISTKLGATSMVFKDFSSVKIESDTLDSIRTLVTAFQGEEVGTSVENISKLTSALEKLTTFNQDGVTNFQNILNQIGDIAVDTLTERLSSGTERVSEAAKGLVNSIVTSFTSSIPNLTMNTISLGNNIGTSIIDGINQSLSGITTTLSGQLSSIVASLNRQTSAFSTIGANIGSSLTTALTNAVGQVPSAISAQNGPISAAGAELMTSLSSGISQSVTTINSTISTTLSSGVTEIRAKYTNFQLAGEYIAEGMAKGIENKTTRVSEAARKLAQAASNAANTELDIDSPSKVFMKTGRYIVEGLAIGITKNTPEAEDSSVKSANAVVKAYQSALQINSPSKVTRDEVGRYIVDGIAEGIEANTSAEEAAKTKASNIVNAFKEELDKFELDTTTADLEYKFWQALNGDATTTQKSQKETELRNKKLAILAEQTMLAEGEYETIARECGVSSEEAQEAYNKYLQAQIDLFDMASEIANSQTDAIQANKDAYIKVNEFLTAQMESLKKIGMTEEEIMKYAQEEYGWDPNMSMLDAGKTTSQSAKEIYQAALAAANGTYASFIEKANKDTQFAYVKGGEGYIAAMAQGVQNGSQAAQDAVKNVTNTVVESATASKTEMNEVGKNFSFSIGDGLKNSRQTLVNVIQNLMTLNPEELSEAASETVKNFMKAIQSAMSNTDELMNYTPTITPVVDMSDVEAKADSINRIFGGGGKTYNVASKTQKTVAAAALAPVASIASRTPLGSAAISFVQNNYSPKALDKSTIYRNTKNLFSSIANKAKNK